MRAIYRGIYVIRHIVCMCVTRTAKSTFTRACSVYPLLMRPFLLLWLVIAYLLEGLAFHPAPFSHLEATRVIPTKWLCILRYAFYAMHKIRK